MSDNWVRTAYQLQQKGLTIQEIANELGVTSSAVNSRLYRYRKKTKEPKQPKQPQPPDKPLDEQLLEILENNIGKEQSIDELCTILKISQRVLEATVQDLQDGGFIITTTDSFIKLQKIAPITDNHHILSWSGDRVIRFGAVADTHLCSKWQQLSHLNALYDLFSKEGINTVLHAGDLTEGVNMRQGHEYEVFRHGADEQVEYVIENYPYRDGIETKFITGNHDHSSIKHSGHDIGYAISAKRKDMTYLGRANAKIQLTPNCVLEINHPLDGSSYAISYGLQKMIDAMSGGEKPNIYLGGHHHKAMYLFYRNVHAFELGTLQAQTAWMRGKRIPAHVGGWIIEVHVDQDGTITRCKGEFIPFYDSIEKDY